MIDHCNDQFSFRPNHHQMTRNHGSKGEEDFNFWGGSNFGYYENLINENADLGRHVEVEFQEHSALLWKTKTSRNYVTNEASRLLPHNHHYSNISSSRLKVITEARKELMERIHDMPESSYELSLKDIVDDPPEVNLKNETQETGFHFETPKQIKKTKSGQISRSGSMEKQTFLIKLAVPSSFSWKAKGKVSKAPSKPSSFRGSESHVGKQWGLKRFLNMDGKRSNSNSSSSSSSSSRSSSIKSSSSSSCFYPGCWLIFGTKKSKNKRLGGCIF